MNGVYGEPVNVHARPDGRPLRFVWRSQLYTVRAILEHWVINREWWRSRDDSRDPAPPGQPEPGQPEPGQPEPGQPEPGQPELEFWRVEAAPGQGMTPGIYELRREVATNTWTLRVS
jgi:hypothetical protein